MDEAAAVKLKADQLRLAGRGTFAELPEPHATDAKAIKSKSGHPLFILFAVVLLGVIAATIFWTKTVNVRLDHASWERTVNIEAFLPREQSSWCDAMPPDGYAVSRRPQVRSQRQIPDGETCNTRRVDRGDGTFQEKQECTPKYRNEPVYADYCNYTVNRWGLVRSIKTAGQTAPPFWGEVRLNGAGGQCQGCEREAKRQEILRLHFKSDEKKLYDCLVSPDVWISAKPGSPWTMKAGALLDNAHCDSLKPVD
jgi:hypothetical protein